MNTDLATIDAPEDLKSNVAACVHWSQFNTVTTPEHLTATGDHLKSIKAALKQADEFFDGPIKTAYELHRTLVGRKKIVTDPLKQAEGIDKQKMLAYQQAEQAKAQAKQRALQAEADAAADRDRQDALRKAAAAKKPETKEKYAEQAAAVVAPVVRVETQAPKVAGVATVKTWKATVVDVNLVPREFLIVDDKKLQAYARAMKEAANVAGVTFAAVESISSRSY